MKPLGGLSDDELKMAVNMGLYENEAGRGQMRPAISTTSPLISTH